jgi:uncharacterized membrane protein YjdF
MSKWINDKTLNIIQVLMFVVVLGVYALSTKLSVLASVRFILLIIGASMTIFIMVIRFTLVDRLGKKQGN